MGMTLEADVAWALPQLRAEAEARMTSRAAVMRTTGRLEQDEESGLESPEWATVVVDEPFMLKGARGANASRTVTIGGVEVTLAVREGHFPAREDDDPRRFVLQDGDLIEITQGRNAGTVWRVVEGDDADQQTAYRVPIIAADRPEEWA